VVKPASRLMIVTGLSSSANRKRGCKQNAPVVRPASSRNLRREKLIESALDEGEQVGIDDVGLRRDHAVRVVLVRLQRAVLEQLG
jgi:hypothetical protein